jgi:two-component system, chemotaxis family, sensor kinase Cph1
LPTIRGDRLRLSEVMQNLIDNGIKFMGDQPMPVIEVGAQGMDADGKPIFFVRDNGIGIDPQYHEHIFGLFNRLDLNVDGTGVGLTIVRRIIEVHGRRIWIESALGKGATFFFTLPAETS